MIACLLDNISEASKADMTSANIILGLGPTILSFFGPTVAETAIISSQRPILAILCSLGAPAIFTDRLFEYSNPTDYLKGKVGRIIMSPVRSQTWMLTISTLQYLLAMIAVANVISNAITLGTQTIVAWKCSWSYFELGWSLMTLTPHVVAAVSMRLSMVRWVAASRTFLLMKSRYYSFTALDPAHNILSARVPGSGTRSNFAPTVQNIMTPHPP
jgi:hypothetical protein